MALTCGFALKATDNSEEFSRALQTIAGDGVTLQGGRFNLTVNGFTATLSSGYALAAGRWVESDEPLAMHINAAGNNEDRVDALVARVDYGERKAALEVLVDVDSAAIRADPSLLRNDEQYAIFLYFIRVRRGATSLTPDDVTDLREDGRLCGRVAPLSAIAGDVLRVHSFLTGGIDREVAQLIGLSDQVAAKADAAIVELEKAIQRAGGGAEIGELLTSRHPPPGEGWIQCTGSTVPEEYPALSEMLGGVLPNIPGDRYKTYIFGGRRFEGAI